MMENKGWGQKKTDPGRGRETQGIFFKEDSHEESDHCSWRKKRAWEFHAICPTGDQKQCLSSSLWEGEPARAKDTFRKTDVKGRDRPPFSPVPGLLFQASLNSHKSGGRTSSQPGNHSEKTHSHCH